MNAASGRLRKEKKTKLKCIEYLPCAKACVRYFTYTYRIQTGILP
jgi:hypothetical protein